MSEFEEKVVTHFLSLAKEDDDTAEQKTCEKFGISEDTLTYILMSDLVDSFSQPDVREA